MYKIRGRREKNGTWGIKQGLESGERVQGIDSLTSEYVSGKILSKVKGNNENLYNINSDQSGHQGWFDMN